VPSATYRLFERAMRERKPVVCMYQGHPRAICPIILGHTDGAEKALTFQFEGSGSKGPVRGQWKCLALAEVSNAEIIDGPWHSGGAHSQSQSCVKDVDLDVNPESPYRPRRRV
jgi:hypothetical protein